MSIALMIGIALTVWVGFGLLVLAVFDLADGNIPHTGPGSSWCPRCGRCSCLDRIHVIDGHGGPVIDVADCTLHGCMTYHPRDPGWR